MPNWDRRFSAGTIRALAYYVHEMGGGEPDAPSASAPVVDPAAPAQAPGSAPSRAAAEHTSLDRDQDATPSGGANGAP